MLGSNTSVLLVHTDLEGGGPQRVVRWLALEHPQRQFEVALLYSVCQHPEPSAELLGQFRDAGVRLYLAGRGHPYGLTFLRVTGDAIREFAPDVVNLHTAPMAMLAPLCRAVSRDARLVYSDHTPIDACGKPWFSWWQPMSLRAVLRYFDRVVCVGTHQAETLARMFVLDDGQIALIQPGIEVPPLDRVAEWRLSTRRSLGIADGEMVVGSIGMMERRKGFHDLLAAFAALPEGVKGHLVLFGEGRDRQEFMGMAEDLGINDRVIFTGYWTGTPVQALAALDVYVHPSYMEAMPAAVIEAGACALPIVATDVGSNRDMVEDGANGFIISAGDTNGLREALLEVLGLSERERMEWGRLSRSKAEGFTAEKMVDGYYRLFADLASQQ